MIKGKKKQGQGGNPQQQNPPAKGNQNQASQNPQGGNNNGQLCQRRNNNLGTNFHCALCGKYVHYTHHFPQIIDYKRMKEAMNPPRPHTPQGPQQGPTTTCLSHHLQSCKMMQGHLKQANAVIKDSWKSTEHKL
jgi:hypothetical protein